MGKNIFYADKTKEYLLVAQREPYLDLEERYNNIIWDAELLSMLCIAYDFLKANNYDFSGDEQTIRDILQSIAASLYDDSHWWAFLHAEAIGNNIDLFIRSTFHGKN